MAWRCSLGLALFNPVAVQAKSVSSEKKIAVCLIERMVLSFCWGAMSFAV